MRILEGEKKGPRSNDSSRSLDEQALVISAGSSDQNDSEEAGTGPYASADEGMPSSMGPASAAESPKSQKDRSELVTFRVICYLLQVDAYVVLFGLSQRDLNRPY